MHQRYTNIVNTTTPFQVYNYLSDPDIPGEWDRLSLLTVKVLMTFADWGGHMHTLYQP